jgi:molybdenum cofactor cytidylyltransferase
MSSVISAVVFAAGTSTRMGSPKLLLPLGGEPIVRRTVRQVSEAGFDDVLVVLGCEHSRILDALEGLSVRNTINRDYETGMGSSFRAAVLDLQGSAASMFALADQPFVTSAHYRQLLETYHRQLSGIVCVRYGDVTAPPHLFDKEFFPELAKLEHGAKPVLQRHRDQTTVLEFPPELLLDVDTPEDYEAALARIRNANL